MSAYDPKRTFSLGSLTFSHEQEIAAGVASSVQRFSTYRIMRLRVSGSGRRPRAAPMFSRMWSTLDVAGMAQVTAGWETMNLRKN